MRDEDPSSEDIDRFDADTAHCPDCGAEIWDEAEVCPKCHAYIGGNTLSRAPLEHWFQRRWVMLVALVLLLALLLWYVM